MTDAIREALDRVAHAVWSNLGNISLAGALPADEWGRLQRDVAALRVYIEADVVRVPRKRLEEASANPSWGFLAIDLLREYGNGGTA